MCILKIDRSLNHGKTWCLQSVKYDVCLFKLRQYIVLFILSIV